MTAEVSIEYWPDYAGDLLHVAGRPVPMETLPIAPDLADRATAWVRAYDDAKLPFGDRPDASWFAEGQAIFVALRDALAEAGITLVDWEGIWAPMTSPDA